MLQLLPRFAYDYTLYHHNSDLYVLTQYTDFNLSMHQFTIN